MSTTVRLRRLESDWLAIQAGLRNHAKIVVASAAGNPPQRYHIEYRVKSLVDKPDGTIVEKDDHLAEISLLRAYPQQPPFCRMLTPVFHPNIAPHAICIGDNWSASETLLGLIFRIGEILAFQSYNIKSPLNGAAAKWVEENMARLPIDKTVLMPPDAPAAGAAAGSGSSGLSLSCDKCGRAGDPEQMWPCQHGHNLCANCRAVCSGCGQPTCPICSLTNCVICFRPFCPNCLVACAGCGRSVCAGDAVACRRCGRTLCPQCPAACPHKSTAFA